MARRGLANLAGLIAFDYSTVSSKSVVVRKKKEDTRNEYLPSFFAVSKNLQKNISINLKNNTCYFK